MKKIILCSMIAISSNLFGQITVKVNGQKINKDQVVRWDESFQTVDISFLNAEKIPEYTVGLSYLKVVATNESGEKMNRWDIEREGYTTVSNFLYKQAGQDHRLVDSEGEMYEFIPEWAGSLRTACRTTLGKNAHAKILNIKVSLLFLESTGYKKYAPALSLLEDFTFKIDISPKDGSLEIPWLGAKLALAKVPNYLGDIREEEKDLSGIGQTTISPVFATFKIQLTKVSTDGKSQDEKLNELTQSFRDHLLILANEGSSNKIKKKLPVHDNLSWDSKTIFRTKSINPTEISSYIELDGTDHPDYLTKEIYEEVSLNQLSGFLFTGLKHDVVCKAKLSMNSAIPGNSGPEPSSVLAGGSVIYFLKHPTDTNSIIIVKVDTKDNINPKEILTNYVTEISGFLSALTF